MVNYPILSSFPTLTTLFHYLRFKAHLDRLMVFSLVYRGTRSWLWWHQGLWHHYCDIRAHDPQLDPFSHHNSWTHTHTLHTNLVTHTHTLHTNLVTLWHSPHQSQSCPQAEEVAFIFSHLCSVLEYALITLENKPYLRMYFSYSGCVTWLFIMVGLSLERPVKILTYSTIWWLGRKQTSKQECAVDLILIHCILPELCLFLVWGPGSLSR